MVKDKNVIQGDWLFTIIGPRPARCGRLRVTVENAEPEDRAFAKALAKVAEAYLNSAARRPRP